MPLPLILALAVNGDTAPTARPAHKSSHAEASYEFDGASFGGRALRVHQAAASVAVNDEVRVEGSYVDILANGRTQSNALSVQGWHLSLAYTVRPWVERPDVAVSLEAEHRAADARARVGDAQAAPPQARLYALRAEVVTKLTDALTLHGRVSGAHVDVGSELGVWVMGLGAAADYRLANVLSLHANVSAFRNVGDAGGTNVAASAGVRLGYRFGPFADASGIAWPMGIPIAEGPLADAAMFRMDPVVQRQAIGREIANTMLGVLSLQAGFRAEW